MRFVLLVMLLSGLFFFRTFTPVFFWSKGKIEELSYFKMKSKLHIQLYTLPSTPFFGYSKYSFRFGKRNSQPSGLRSGWVSKFRVLNKRMNFFWDPVFHCFIIWFPIGIFLSVFFLRPKKRYFFDSNHFSELQLGGCVWCTRGNFRKILFWNLVFSFVLRLWRFILFGNIILSNNIS